MCNHISSGESCHNGCFSRCWRGTALSLSAHFKHSLIEGCKLTSSAHVAQRTIKIWCITLFDEDNLMIKNSTMHQVPHPAAVQTSLREADMNKATIIHLLLTYYMALHPERPKVDRVPGDSIRNLQCSFRPKSYN